MGWFEICRAQDGQFYFNLKAVNGQVILTSEMYTQKHNALAGVQSVQVNSPLPERFETRVSKAQEPYFVLKAANGLIIGVSQMYSSNQARETGIQSVMQNGSTQDVRDMA